jgi:hypothetical protein
MKRLLLVLAAAAVALAVGGSAVPAPRDVHSSPAGSRYPWPLAPFDEPHPVRAAVGDPRTIFRGAARENPLGASGTFSFHNGIDIDARNGTPVYPVVSGIARWITDDDGVLVQADDGRLFMYRHIVPAVRQWERVTARETVLGRVENWAEELHFSEFTPDERIANPLLPGHLAPNADTTSPTVARLHFRDRRGKPLASFDLHGRIAVSAEAYDTPMPVAPASRRAFSVSKFAQDRFPVAPAALTWSLSTLGDRVVVPFTRVADFRLPMPQNTSLWTVYARGTFQNRSVIGGRMHSFMPGRFLFRLTPSPLDTRKLANGVYVATVTATDASGNRGSLSERLEIWNSRRSR